MTATDKIKTKDKRKTCFSNCLKFLLSANYETGVSGYKHIYFNVTLNTLVIWSFTVIAIIGKNTKSFFKVWKVNFVIFAGLYEAVRHVFTALIYGCARPRMALLFLSSLFPHIYGWWANFNYFNDDYFNQVWHQFFFSITELCSTMMVLHLVNKNNFTELPKKLLFVIRYDVDLFLTPTFEDCDVFMNVDHVLGLIFPQFPWRF